MPTIDNVPNYRVQHRGLTIEGYSRAAVQTHFRILPIGICFDMGACPWSYVSTPRVALSHLHLDHAAALPSYVGRRQMLRMSPPTVYVPEQTVGAVRAMLDAWAVLDVASLDCELVGLSPGQQVSLSNRIFMRAVPMAHPVPTLGYILYERRTKLKSQYQGLPSVEIGRLARQGTQVKQAHDVPIVAYVGDTGAAGLDAHPDIYRAQVLVTEITFVRPNPNAETLEKIRRFGHLHLVDVLERADAFQNELILVSHLTTRHDRQDILEFLDQDVPAALRQRMVVWI